MAVDPDDLRAMAAGRLAKFSATRKDKIGTTDVRQLLARKNPYLYRYLGFETTEKMVEALLAAWLSSSDETNFGSALEDIAVYVCRKAFGGGKSAAEGIDLEFAKDGKQYVVSVKSGPNWGNADQRKKMIDNFDSARKRLRQNKGVGEIRAVNGCCYGKTPKGGGHVAKGDYWKLCGREFWELISDNPTMYKDLFDIVAEVADKRHPVDDFSLMSPLAQRAAQSIRDGYNLPDGKSLNWHLLLEELHSING